MEADDASGIFRRTQSRVPLWMDWTGFRKISRFRLFRNRIRLRTSLVSSASTSFLRSPRLGPAPFGASFLIRRGRIPSGQQHLVVPHEIPGGGGGGGVVVVSSLEGIAVTAVRGLRRSVSQYTRVFAKYASKGHGRWSRRRSRHRRRRRCGGCWRRSTA